VTESEPPGAPVPRGFMPIGCLMLIGPLGGITSIPLALFVVPVLPGPLWLRLTLMVLVAWWLGLFEVWIGWAIVRFVRQRREGPEV